MVPGAGVQPRVALKQAAALALAAAALAVPTARAEALRYCDQPAPISAAQQDRLFRFAAIVKDELERSGARTALIARAGLDLGRFGVRYSHGGVSLRASPNGPWSVRQLYYACDERRPRLYDQGIAGFLLGTNDASVGWVSLVLLPEAPGQALERTALDGPRALGLLGASYSANAHAFALRYQNCNQWLAELLAAAWAPIAPGAAQRVQAQQWLAERGYEPGRIEPGTALLWLGLAVPWIHNDDHPPADLAAGRYRLSLPAAIEDFVRANVPGAQRIELCHDARQVVLRRGWTPIADGCRAGEGDTVIAFD